MCSYLSKSTVLKSASESQDLWILFNLPSALFPTRTPPAHPFSPTPFSFKHPWPSHTVNFSCDVSHTDEDFFFSIASYFPPSLLSAFIRQQSSMPRLAIYWDSHICLRCISCCWISFSFFSSNVKMSPENENWRALKKCKRHHYMRMGEGEADFWLSDSSSWVLYDRVKEKMCKQRYILLF